MENGSLLIEQLKVWFDLGGDGSPYAQWVGVPVKISVLCVWAISPSEKDCRFFRNAPHVHRPLEFCGRSWICCSLGLISIAFRLKFIIQKSRLFGGDRGMEVGKIFEKPTLASRGKTLMN